MSGRTITLRVFCSAKGGVGKSTLAVATARLLANEGRTCVLLDADLTGTSLADGLRLCAPEVARLPDGNLDFDAAPTGRHLTRAETIKQRNARKDMQWEGQPPAPPFLNDILIYEKSDNSECQVEALLWRHEDRDDKVWYLPSSPCEREIAIALGWLYREQPFTWLSRLMWLLDGMSEQMKTLTDVVIDLPPGLFGFAHEALVLLSSLKNDTPFPSGFPTWNQGGVTWKGKPLLVSTPDRNDLVLALEYLIGHKPELPHLDIVLNRYASSRESELREVIREHFGEALGVEGLLPKNRIDELGPLREVFTQGRLRLNDDVRKLRRQLGLEGAE
ncbi:MAG: P-loop NTPase [Byssovorax sp.]